MAESKNTVRWLVFKKEKAKWNAWGKRWTLFFSSSVFLTPKKAFLFKFIRIYVRANTCVVFNKLLIFATLLPLKHHMNRLFGRANKCLLYKWKIFTQIELYMCVSSKIIFLIFRSNIHIISLINVIFLGILFDHALFWNSCYLFKHFWQNFESNPLGSVVQKSLEKKSVSTSFRI